MAWKHNYKPPKGYVEKPVRGKGWGGDAKGEGKAFSATNQPSPEAKSAGKAAAATAKAMAQEHAVEMMQLLLSIARDPNTPSVTRADIAEKVINRGEGKAAASMDITTKGERMGYVIPAPPEAEDAAAWATQHKPN